jgi:hypothetical protein
MSDRTRKILTKVLAIVLAASMVASSAYFLISTLFI